MNEFIEIELRSKGTPIKITRQIDDGRIELSEPDPISRRVSIGLSPSEAITQERMRSVRQRLGWRPDQFGLKVSVERGCLILRGVDPNALPRGRYRLRVEIEEAKTKKQPAVARVLEEGNSRIAAEITLDDRQISVDLEFCDPLVGRVIDASVLDKMPAREWLASPDWRPSKRACLLNLLANLRARPTVKSPLIDQVRQITVAFRDRVYAAVGPTLNGTLIELSRDSKLPFYHEGRPTASIHERLLDSIPSEERHLFSKERLVSFRGEGSPSLQICVAQPSGGEVAYAEFDLDLGNALQDVVGIIVHVGELIDGKPTNHLDLFKKLAKQPKVSQYLYYQVL